MVGAIPILRTLVLVRLSYVPLSCEYNQLPRKFIYLFIYLFKVSLKGAFWLHFEHYKKPNSVSDMTLQQRSIYQDRKEVPTLQKALL